MNFTKAAQVVVLLIVGVLTATSLYAETLYGPGTITIATNQSIPLLRAQTDAPIDGVTVKGEKVYAIRGEDLEALTNVLKLPFDVEVTTNGNFTVAGQSAEVFPARLLEIPVAFLRAASSESGGRRQRREGRHMFLMRFEEV